MIIVMGKNASQESVEGVIGFIRNKGLKEHISRGGRADDYRCGW